LNNIGDIFGLYVENERCGDYRYSIENIEDITEGGLQSWLFNTFAVSNALTGCMGIKDRIQLEYVPSGELYLQPIIDAMKENRVINITYKSYWEDSQKNYDVQPLCLKLFRQRWYVIVRKNVARKDAKIWICGLDRILSLQKTEETFTMPKDWDVDAYFDGFIGVIRDEDYDKEIVKIKVNAKQANYLRDLKIHRSQQEAERNDEYSIFTYCLRPTFDFQQELLWNADKVEVLEPQWLRDEMADIIQKMLDLYKEE
jgi:predicted DNA-binding transcriptional regulator YafY